MADVQKPEAPQEEEIKGVDLSGVKDKASKMWGGMKRWEQISFVGGVAYLISLFLPFLGYAGEYSKYLDIDFDWAFNDTDGLWPIMGYIVAIGLIVLPIINMLTQNIKLPYPKRLLTLVLGVVGVILPILYYITFDGREDAGFKYGFFVMVIAGAVGAYGGYMGGGLADVQKLTGGKKAPPPPGTGTK
jgi:heme/copper-type cytochrome/quinol oxidase subunit 4